MHSNSDPWDGLSLTRKTSANKTRSGGHYKLEPAKNKAMLTIDYVHIRTSLLAYQSKADTVTYHFNLWYPINLAMMCAGRHVGSRAVNKLG